MLAGPIEIPASDVRLLLAVFVGGPVLLLLGALVALRGLLRGSARIQPPPSGESEISPVRGGEPER